LNGPLAQLVEHRPFKAGVPSSTLGRLIFITDVAVTTLAEGKLSGVCVATVVPAMLYILKNTNICNARFGN
jgi:hypothetical protein